MLSSACMKAYLRSTSDANASWTVNGCQNPWQGTKPANSRNEIFSPYYYNSHKNVIPQ